MNRAAAGIVLGCVAGSLTFDPTAAQAKDARPHRYAVVVGANKAAPGRRDLRHAHRDAQEVADTLIRVADYDYDNVTVLLDPDPAHVLAALDASLARETPDSEALLFFYYSGHADSDALYPNGRPLPLPALRQRLDDGRIRVRVGVIDACRGGGWTGAKGLTPAPPFPVEWPLTLSNRGSVLIASSSGAEDAHESEALRGSFFTHHWNAGLRGAADLNGDSTVTASEAFDYAQGLTVRDTALVATTPQHPSFRIDLSGRRDLPLVSLNAAKTTLTLSQTAGPLQLVHLDTGVVVLESPRGKRSLRLWTRPGRYLVRVRAGSEIRAKEIDLGPDATLTVRESDLQAVAPGPLATKSADERDVSAPIVKAGLVEMQLALGVRHAPVIDPGLRWGEGGAGPVGIMRLTFGLGRGWQLAAPLALAYGAGDPVGWSWVAWGGVPTVGLGETEAGDSVVAALVGAGADLRAPAWTHATLNGSVSALGSYRSTSAPTQTPDTWGLQLSAGFTQFVSDAVSLSLGVAASHNVTVGSELAPWDRTDARANLVVALGSVQRRGLRPLPLVRVYLGDRFTLDGHVALAYLPATKSFVETYLAGLTTLF